LIDQWLGHRIHNQVTNSTPSQLNLTLEFVTIVRSFAQFGTGQMAVMLCGCECKLQACKVMAAYLRAVCLETEISFRPYARNHVWNYLYLYAYLYIPTGCPQFPRTHTHTSPICLHVNALYSATPINTSINFCKLKLDSNYYKFHAPP